jgi:DNA polymerase III delta prime subunit
VVQCFGHANIHYFVLDEVDNLSTEAQRSLKAVMNLPHALFILTTNFITKIDQAVKDRCHLVEMNAPTAEQYVSLMRRIASSVGWGHASDAELIAIADGAYGSIREIGRRIQIEAQLRQPQAA